MSDQSLSPDWLTLGTDEQVLIRTAPSTNLVLAGLVVGFVLLLMMSLGISFVASLETGRIVSFIILVVIVGILVAAYGISASREYVLTDERACVGQGLSDKQPTSVDLTDVHEIHLTQPTWQRLLSLGTVQFVTRDGEHLTFRLIENPGLVSQQADRLVKNHPHG
ncbi:MAG: putative membrane protein YdbT with pleckstrin-like domain [Haloarculaceae archaeon]|jgi:uncharacterized membrane protein YdbT with pleckstrin-like domain